MTEKISQEEKERLESVPSVDWGSVDSNKPLETKAPKRRGRPPKVETKTETETPKVKVKLSSIRALDGAIKMAGALPIVVAHKVGRAVTKGKMALLGDAEATPQKRPLIPPEMFLDCQEKFAEAAGVVEAELTPWQSYGIALLGAIGFGVAQYMGAALNEWERERTSHANSLNGAGTNFRVVRPNDVQEGGEVTSAP